MIVREFLNGSCRGLMGGLIALTLVACSDSSTTTVPSGAAAPSKPTTAAAAAPTPDLSAPVLPRACDAVTPDMLTGALGGSFVAGRATQAPGSGTACVFADGGLTVAVSPGGGLIFDALRTSYTDAVEVPGVADGAYYSKASSVLVFLKGSAVGQLFAADAAYNDQARMAALATAIAARL